MRDKLMLNVVKANEFYSYLWYSRHHVNSILFPFIRYLEFSSTFSKPFGPTTEIELFVLQQRMRLSTKLLKYETCSFHSAIPKDIVIKSINVLYPLIN